MCSVNDKNDDYCYYKCRLLSFSATNILEMKSFKKKCTPLLFTFSKPQSRLFNTSQWMDAITSQNKAETIEFETGSLRSVYL
jgi:hypothetical protein